MIFHFSAPFWHRSHSFSLFLHVKRLPRKTLEALNLLYYLQLLDDCSNTSRSYCTSTSRIANIRLTIRVKWRQPAGLTYAPLYLSVPWKGVQGGNQDCATRMVSPLLCLKITLLLVQFFL